MVGCLKKVKMINPDLKNVIKGWDRNSIASKIANDLPHASYVNLGIGMPELVSQHIKEDREIIYHSENGLLGMGPTPNENEIDLDLINAGKKPVTILPGGSFCHHADSFSMIRGGHIDYCVLGAMEVSINGDLANWSTGKGIPAVGGAMDLVAGAKNVFVMTQHITKEGKPKLVQTCTLPLTGAGVVSRVYSDYAVIDITKEGFKVIDINQNISMEFLQNITDGKVYQ